MPIPSSPVSPASPASPAAALPPSATPFLLPAAALFALLLAVYATTLLPGVGYHPDTARFQFVPRVLGIPHQTGFPTYLLLDRLFTELLPVGRPAWRANLFSAVASALACTVLLRLLLDLRVRPAPAFAAALAFGLTRTLWSQSVVAEVYSLNLLSTALVLLFFLRWGRDRRCRDFALATALYAISFGNHLLAVTLLPAIAWWVWRTDRRAFLDPRKISWVLAWAVLGAAQYSYLLWRTHDPATLYLEHAVGDLPRLWWYVSGGPARGRMLAFGPRELLAVRLPLLGRLLMQNFGPLLALCALGLAALGRRPENRFLLLALAGPAAFALSYDIPDVFVYFLPVYLVLAIWLGVGLGTGLDRLTPAGPGAARATVLAVLPLALLAVNKPLVDQSGNREQAEEIETALATADRDAVLLAPARAYSRMVYYYLLAEGWQARGLAVTWSPERAAAYLQGQPLYLPEQRRELGPGRPLYSIGGLTAARRTALEAAGETPLEIRRRRTVLYLAAGDPRVRAAALAALTRRVGRAPGTLVRFEPEVPRLTLFEPDPLPDPKDLRRGPVTVECAIEQVEERGAWRRPVKVSRTGGFLSVRGWALDGERPAGGVFAELDGRLLPALYGLRRADSPGAPDCRGCGRRGFEALIRISGIAPGRHRLGIAVLSHDGEEIRPCSRRVHLDLR